MDEEYLRGLKEGYAEGYEDASNAADAWLKSELTSVGQIVLNADELESKLRDMREVPHGN